jgi:integrase
VIDLGYSVETKNGKKRRAQKWVTFRPAPGTSRREAYKQAQAKLAELLVEMHKGTYVDATKMTLIDFLRDWYAKSVEPLKKSETARLYKSIIERIAKSSVASVPLQQLRAADLERYYAGLDVAPNSVTIYHAIIHRALRMAVRDKLITANPASAVEDRPRPDRGLAQQTAKDNCWSVAEARAFLKAAKRASKQMAAFAHLALDSGARKSELLGLAWSAVDFEAGTIEISRQLARGVTATFSTTKTGRSRRISLAEETLTYLRVHKQSQAVLKLKNRTTYQDYGLVFAKQDSDLQLPTAKLGDPCPGLADWQYERVIKAAGVKRIKFHGLRHTSATLALSAGVPVHVVAARLGHSTATMTLNIYAHALPDMQKDAAARLGAVLHG